MREEDCPELTDHDDVRRRRRAGAPDFDLGVVQVLPCPKLPPCTLPRGKMQASFHRASNFLGHPFMQSDRLDRRCGPAILSLCFFCKGPRVLTKPLSIHYCTLNPQRSCDNMKKIVKGKQQSSSLIPHKDPDA